MIEHELEDAQAAYVEAVYNFRKAEEVKVEITIQP